MNSSSANIVFLTISALLVTSCLACRPILRFIESECCGDDYVEIAREWIGVNNEPNITAQGIENRYLSTCPEGLWMGYEHENYTGMTSLLEGRNDGLNNCRYENTGRKFRSTKIVGSSANFYAKALVTYTLKWAEGEDSTYFNDTNSLSPPYNTIILTGSEEIELFTGNYFNGLSVCVRPNNGYINGWTDFQNKNDLTNGTDLYTELSDLAAIFGTSDFQSFKFGCRENTNTLFTALRHTYHL